MCLLELSQPSLNLARALEVGVLPCMMRRTTVEEAEKEGLVNNVEVNRPLHTSFLPCLSRRDQS